MSDAQTKQTIATRRELQRTARRSRQPWFREPSVDVRAFYRDIIGIQNEEVIELYTKNTTYIARNKGEVFVHAGEPVATVRFLLRGVTRGYIIDEKGQDHIISFAFDYGEAVIGSMTPILPSQLYMEAVTDIELLEIPLTVIMEGLGMDVSCIHLYEQQRSLKDDRELSVHIALSTLSGEERYQWFLSEYRDIADIVPQNYIASFLGIQPQSLSRIKRQLREQKAEEPV